MEPNCCPHCQRTLSDKEVIRMYKRYCAGQRKPKVAQPAHLEISRIRDEIRKISEEAKVKADPRYDYSEAS